MTQKEKIDIVIKEWKWLLEGLPKAKYKQYRYARIYTKIVEHNQYENVKLLLPIAYRVFNEIDDITTTKSSKNFIPISHYGDDLVVTLVDRETIESYVKAIALLIVERLQSGMSLGYLSIQKEELGIVN